MFILEKLSQDWIDEQSLLLPKVIYENQVDLNTLRYVAGLDISMKSDNNACAYITIMDYKTNKIVYEDYKKMQFTVPYISGFLAFREVNFYVDLIKTVPEKYKPDLLLVDGFGTLHHRRLGSATHLGVVANIPTIGIGKKLLQVFGLNEIKIKQELANNWTPDKKYVYMQGNDDIIYGAAFSRDNGNPIYVSTGHKIDLETSLIIIEKLTKRFRIPEPIRNSDIKSKLYLD